MTLKVIQLGARKIIEISATQMEILRQWYDSPLDDPEYTYIIFFKIFSLTLKLEIQGNS